MATGASEPNSESAPLSTRAHLDFESDPSGTFHTLCGQQPRPVVVIIGGASGLATKDRAFLEPLFDRGIAAAASRAGAVVLTGGTQSGVMDLALSALGGRSSVTTVGVAPRSMTRDPMVDGPGAEDLDLRNEYFVLTEGHSWGSETETLFALAEAITDGKRSGVVVLANGGATARSETLRFLKAGWPILCLDGSGREADALASLVRSRDSSRTSIEHALVRPRKSLHGWGDVGSSDVEVHPKDGSPELLFRRLSWRLSDRLLIKDAWNKWSAFDEAAKHARKVTSRLQLAVLGVSILLVVLSVLYGSHDLGSRVRPLIVALPVTVALASALTETLLPARNWTGLRAAAESVQRAIYRYWSVGTNEVNGRSIGGSLTKDLADVDHFLLRSDVLLAVVSSARSRPQGLPPSFDELGPLTLRAYTEERLEDQLRYYRRTARVMRTRQTTAVVASALLAAIATATAAELSLALWVPVLIFLASTVTVLQQRSRWHERIRLYGLTVAELDAVRTHIFTKSLTDIDLPRVVDSVEAILDKEQSGWMQNMSRAMDESSRYPLLQTNDFK